MFRQLAASWTVAAGVVMAAFGIYVTFVVLVRVVGQRSLASMSSFDFGCAVALPVEDAAEGSRSTSESCACRGSAHPEPGASLPLPVDTRAVLP
jgi:hypothetical protein